MKNSSRRALSRMQGIFFAVSLLVLIMPSFVIALHANEASSLPPNLQKLQEYNQQQAELYLQTISFLIVFIAGALSLLSPCIVPLIPSFFAYTFKEKKNIAKMTFIFFLGFSLVFVIFGVIASIIGSSVGSLQFENGWIVTIAGIFLILLGLMTLFGKGFSSFFKPQKEFQNDALGTFLFGMSFAAGWSACVGPVLAGILLVASTFHNYVYGGLLLFTYAVGFFIPLFILALFADKFKIAQSKFLNKSFTVAGKKFYLLNILSGLLFVMLGAVFIIYRGTGVLNDYDPIKLSQYFYSLQGQLVSLHLPVQLGNILFWVIVLILGAGAYSLFKKSKAKKNEGKR